MGDSFFVKYSIFVFPVFMSIFAIFCLIIVLAAVIKNKPLIINTKWLLVIILISATPILIDGIIVNASFKGISTLFFSIIYSLLIILIIVSLLLIRSYSIFCAKDIDIRDAIIYSLNNNSLEFEEKINKFHLININNELKISFPSTMEFTGNGTITMKNKKGKLIFKKIINDIKLYIRENNIKPNKKAVIFHLIYSIFLILMCVFLGIFFINLNEYIK
ncbi:MAG: hypothetical protein LBP19_01170 [Treponema sp.]|nr:hypothetical protein [Treponema sp.]